MKPSLTRTEWLSVLSGMMIAGLLVAVVVTLVLHGDVVVSNIAELSFVIAGFGALVGYQLGVTIAQSEDSFLWSIGFTTTVLIAFFSIAIVEDLSLAPLLIIILVCSSGGLLALMLSGEATKVASLEVFMRRWFRWIASGLLLFHIVIAYLSPSAGYVWGQIGGGITDPDLVTLWFLLLVVVIAVVPVVWYFSLKVDPAAVEPVNAAESRPTAKKSLE